MKSKFLSLIAYCLLVLSLSNGLLIVLSPKAGAQNLNLQVDEINIAPDVSIPTPTSPAVPTTQDGKGDNIKEGLQGIAQTGPVTLLSSVGILDFGQIAPSNPVIRNVRLSVLNNFTNYRILAYENHPPRTVNNEVLPDTTCDNGLCDENEQTIWESNLTYGFGFNCFSDSLLICTKNNQKDYYRQFANISDGDKPKYILHSLRNKDMQNAQINLKVNASGTQEAGVYSNTVTFVLVSDY